MIGQRLSHDSSKEHACGESIFIDDRPLTQGEVFIGIVGAPVSAGTISEIKTEKALKLPGVLAVYTAKDLQHNHWGSIKKDQPLLVEKEIGYIHEPVALVVTDNRDVLAQAKKAVEVVVKEKTAVLSLQEAIDRKEFLYSPKPLVVGDADKALKNSPHRLSGKFEMGGQEHFYLETQAAIAYPLEGNQFEIHSSSQHPSEVQHMVADALGVPFHQVVCIVKRMGGAFGGKESQAGPFAVYAALAAAKLKRPARMVLGQEEDFQITGKRHPFSNFYEVGFDDQGKILALKMKLFSDGGAYLDLSSSILDRAIYHADGAYYLENAHLEGHVCKTNHHSNTAFRGFGGPQGNMTTENIIEEIAIFLKKDAAEIRRLNCYQEGQKTHYGQEVTKNFLPKMMDQLLKESDYHKRRKEIEKHNNENPEKLKGMSMTACKFGIAFTAKFLNQGNALVNIHRDGSVQVSTGATEMGQGVNTKIQQVVASCFNISADLVKVMATSTEKNHNTSPTAASSGSDINAGAALKAAEALKQRLLWVAHHSQNLNGEEIPAYEPKKLDEKLLKIMPWEKLVDLAYKNRIGLGEYAHFKTEGLNAKAPFRYFTSGVAISEVEINSYTGELKIIRSDLLMDIGRPINPGIDEGQITGGFIQGVGWVTTENLCYEQKGRMTSKSPTTYKIPNVQDLPRTFNFKVIENNTNDVAVARSKAVGEPPLLLSASVLLAVKNALSYRSKGQIPKLSSPAVPEVILMELTKYES
jgi:xanthine dehydrogenase large subunit